MTYTYNFRKSIKIIGISYDSYLKIYKKLLQKMSLQKLKETY